ncbi:MULTISPECIES: ABC transporter substrate-binding protein [unclassified Lebetimonas]|uniref:ABC transporter substrate-binding protein n=1 Tax=unclassified Lebetimonas TaxID=2648158 RepID=UPI000466B543|nr:MULTISPECIES: ABC transporter substrate-binding protein [unclassified Lebetimonas]
MKKIFLILILIIIIISYILFSAPKKYIISSSLPLSGIMKNMGESIKYGTLAYYNNFNIPNKEKIKFIFKDDKYEPDLMKMNIINFYNNNSFLLYGLTGTPTVKAVLPFVNEHSIFVFAPFTGAEFLRKNKNVVNFRASYKDEIEHIINYLLKKHINKISLLYQNDDYGDEIYLHLCDTLKKHKLSLSSVGTYERNTYLIDSALNSISSSKPQAIILGSTAEIAALFIKNYRKIDKNVLFITISFVNPDKLISLIKNKNNIIFSEVVPYYKANITEAKNYLTSLHKLNPKTEPTFYGFESYLATKILINAFNHLTFPYTQEHLKKIIKKTPKNILKGIPIEYKNNHLLNKTYLYKYKNNVFKEIQ